MTWTWSTSHEEIFLLVVPVSDEVKLCKVFKNKFLEMADDVAGIHVVLPQALFTFTGHDVSSIPLHFYALASDRLHDVLLRVFVFYQTALRYSTTWFSWKRDVYERCIWIFSVHLMELYARILASCSPVLYIATVASHSRHQDHCWPCQSIYSKRTLISLRLQVHLMSYVAVIATCQEFSLPKARHRGRIHLH